MDRIAYSNLGKYLESHEKGEIIANRLKTGHEVPEQFLECTCIEVSVKLFVAYFEYFCKRRKENNFTDLYLHFNL